MTSEAPISIDNPITTSLDEQNFQENYTHWAREVVHVLRGNSLEGYLDGTVTIDYEVWQKQDEKIFFWMLSSLSPAILDELIHRFVGSAFLLWKQLRHMFVHRYFPVVGNLRAQLESIKRNDSTCDKFLKEVQLITDKLIQAGSFVDYNMIVHYILNGLGHEYEPFVSNVITLSMAEPITMLKLHRLILDEEARLFSLPQLPIVPNQPPPSEPNDMNEDDFVSSLLNID